MLNAVEATDHSDAYQMATASTGGTHVPSAPGLVERAELDRAFGIDRTVSQDKALANVDARLRATRDALFERGGYVGNATTRQHVKWLMENRMQRLVTAEAVAQAQEALAAYTLQNDPRLPVPDPAESVELTVIVRINPDNCFVQADSYWTSESVSGAFEKIKLRFQGVAPTRPEQLRQDFANVCTNLEEVMNAVQDGSDSKEGLLSGERGACAIHFRHAVFERLNDENGYTEDDMKMPAMYRMDGWPVSSREARLALQDIRDTHRPRPLPAYDMHGALIPPTDYTKMLRGALAIVRFNVVAYTFGKPPKHRQTFCADVTYVRVLVPPTAPSLPVSPRKRRVHARDPFAALLEVPNKTPRVGGEGGLEMHAQPCRHRVYEWS
ncbi:hypothetical protein OBBRIDRAFT_806695 [Obba rivulosa]|uniref:Uncharacterized protein n=1 Tax=Obba rivulosa TaxID=1052685 RepID=A0A8E2AL82_9APHY|nr:hypothetical protein OBBRIDRAFT_806695 [Obba rivulosa]